MKHRSNGEDAVMGAKGKRSYDWETKVAGEAPSCNRSQGGDTGSTTC